MDGIEKGNGLTRTETIEKLLEEAWQLRGKGNYKESRKILITAESLCTKEDFNYLGRIYHIRMQYEADKDHFDRAMEYCHLSVSSYIKSEDSDKIAHSVRHLADLQLKTGKLHHAHRNYVKSIDIYRSQKDCNKGDLANALIGYANLLEERKKFTEAIDLWQEIIHLYRESNFEQGELKARQKLNQLRNKKI